MEQKRASLSHAFGKFAARMSTLAGHSATFGVAVFCLIVWAVSGPFLDYSTGWQLMVNTGTTICTFTAKRTSATPGPLEPCA